MNEQTRVTRKLYLAIVASAALLCLVVVGFMLANVKGSDPVPKPVLADVPVPTATSLSVAQVVATLPPAGTPTRDNRPNPAEVTSSPTALPPAPPPLLPISTEPVFTPTVVEVQAAVATATPAANSGAQAPSVKKVPAVALLPNGVLYGDHTPDLPDRVVRIVAPSIKLDTNVYEVYAKNGAWEVAEYAAGHNYNSKNPGEGGNIVLAGHNNWRGEVFRYLEKLQPGDEITLWTLEGKPYKYAVQQVEKLKEAGAPMAQRIENGKVMLDTPSEQLTLITCWPYTTFTHRLIVIAKPVS